MPDEPSPDEFEESKETVVRRPGAEWSFTLPDEHTIQVWGHDFAGLWAPRASSLYSVSQVIETDEELIVCLDQERAWIPDAHYPLPEIQDEIERLRARWRQTGLPEQEFEAYAPGETP